MIKELESELNYQNRILKQLKRQGAIALYAVYGEGGVLYGYEVIRIRRLPAQLLFGRSYPEREAYPNEEQWGRLAWSYGLLQEKRAFTQFENLVAQYGNGYVGKEE